MSPGKGSLPSPVGSEKGREIRVPGSYDLSGGRGANFLQAPLRVVILKGAPGKAKRELMAGILSWGLDLNVQTWVRAGCHTVKCLCSNAE